MDPSSSDEDLAWDPSPEQISLQSPPPTYDPQSSTPIDLKTIVTLPPPFSRTRIQAFTRPPLSRQPAFRKQHPNHAFIHSQDTSPRPSTSQLPKAPKKPRVPTPLSPSLVDTAQVTDISLLPKPLTPVPSTPYRRSSRLFAKNAPANPVNKVQTLREEEEEKKREKPSCKC